MATSRESGSSHDASPRADETHVPRPGCRLTYISARVTYRSSPMTRESNCNVPTELLTPWLELTS